MSRADDHHERVELEGEIWRLQRHLALEDLRAEKSLIKRRRATKAALRLREQLRLERNVIEQAKGITQSREDRQHPIPLL